MSIAAAGMTGFFELSEVQACQDFLDNGFVIRPAADPAALERLRDLVAGAAAQALDLPLPADVEDFLNGIHRHVAVDGLNDVRLQAINAVNAEPWVRRAYFEIARDGLELLVGNELVMQRRLNLSIQMPDDDSSLLAAHADVYDGDSPFEVVVWLPLVDCRDSKSMFFLPPEANARIEAEFGRYQTGSTEDLFRDVEDDLVWIDIPYGSYLLFNQNMIHGNRVNRINETRWSMNCRFKSVFSPYAGKRLGEFFEPITLRPASRIGMRHELPERFHE